MLTHAKRKTALEVLEAVATLPVMLLILGAVVNLGMAVYAQQAVQNAANYGARMGSTSVACRSCEAARTAWTSLSQSGVHSPGVAIEAPGGVVGSTLRIRASGDVPNLMGGLMAFFGQSSGPIQVSAVATFRAEGW
jgi:TadE-like protein